MNALATRQPGDGDELERPLLVPGDLQEGDQLLQNLVVPAEATKFQWQIQPSNATTED